MAGFKMAADSIVGTLKALQSETSEGQKPWKELPRVTEGLEIPLEDEELPQEEKAKVGPHANLEG